MLHAATAEIHGVAYKLDALPDPADFRDRLFIPTLSDVPLYVELDEYLRVETPVLDQGAEGSCTGFALATVAHYLLRTRAVVPDPEQVSPRMLYEMAKRYDEWEGEEYEGSSARGAMKGWHKHGVCSAALWTYDDGERDRVFTVERAQDALTRPLGAYFRVDYRDLTAMHSALAEVGILLASSRIHEGWYDPHPDSGRIGLASRQNSGHAFAVVGYNQEGFWIQSSWGLEWGKQGIALLTYDDWLLNGMDVWVARLGVPINVTRPRAKAKFFPPTADDLRALGLARIRSHVVRVDTSGQLSHHGPYATFEEDVARIFEQEIPAQTQNWPVRRILLYAGSGLESEDVAVGRMSSTGARMLEQGVYPLAFIWNSDLLTVLQTVVQAAVARLSPAHGAPGPGLDFSPQRLDDALEPLVRDLGGRLLWENVKTYGYRAAKNEAGAARIVLQHLLRFFHSYPDAELHVLAHSAGSVFLAPLVQHMTAEAGQRIQHGPMRGRTGAGLSLATTTLWAPALRTDLFAETYLPAIAARQIERFALYTLTDQAEREDCCVGPYSKSLLYLISNALEEVCRVPVRQPFGQPLVGLERFARSNQTMDALWAHDNAAWVLSPNDHPETAPNAARSQTHVQFEETITFYSTMQRILGHDE